MKRTARIGFATALLMGGATLAVAQNGPPTGGYQPVRWNPNLYYNYYNYYAWPYCVPFYYLAPHYYPGDYPGAPDELGLLAVLAFASRISAALVIHGNPSYLVPV